jgi:hypothetical protein
MWMSRYAPKERDAVPPTARATAAASGPRSSSPSGLTVIRMPDPELTRKIEPGATAYP